MINIGNLVYVDETWRFEIDGLTNFLTNAGRGLNDGARYTWIIPNGEVNEFFGIMGDGNYLSNNEVSVHYILNRIGTTDFFLISVANFRENMELADND